MRLSCRSRSHGGADISATKGQPQKERFRTYTSPKLNREDTLEVSTIELLFGVQTT